ncbi:MAG: hypothetical protein CM15mP125_0460 [Gammaproteobacteria bacterium]|nr:MAG: hypothetical protein CM15mP125_0460 [Gammaproteobacteria bacterium]
MAFRLIRGPLLPILFEQNTKTSGSDPNNVYHDMAVTESIGQLVAKSAREQRKDIASSGSGGLSGAFFRQEINPEDDRIFRRHMTRQTERCST